MLPIPIFSGAMLVSGRAIINYHLPLKSEDNKLTGLSEKTIIFSHFHKDLFPRQFQGTIQYFFLMVGLT